MSSRSRPGPPPGDPYREPYGPPPREPYQPPGEPYQPPADPWGQATDAWGAQPTDAWAGQSTAAAGYPGGGHPGGGHPAAGYPGGDLPGPPGQPPPAPPAAPPRRNVGLYAVVAVLVLLAATGVGYALFVLSGDGDPGAGGTPGPAGTPGSPDPSASPQDNIGLSAAVARVDDCLVNDGSTEQTQMRIVRCDEDPGDAAVFRVLAVIDQRVDGEDDQARHASAQAICASTEGYTHHYFEIGETASFVLCMVEQE
jgi:hypothetical protein